MKVKNKIEILTCDQEPIVALCSARGSGAIALIRISGFGAIELISKIAKLSSGKKLADTRSHTINHGFVLNPLENEKLIIDEVLFFLMRGPKTFTGQDTVEISCHNNPFIIEKIINLAISSGARQATHGEFSLRSFLNKKIDLVQAEAINEIIGSQTESALKKSMAQLNGTLSSFISEIEQKLLNLLSIIEGGLEFLEEELEELNLDKKIKDELHDIIEKLNHAKSNFNQMQQIKTGIKICIIGSVNAGKSTLFNAILKKDRAIVNNTKGTTRDVIESTIYKSGCFWTVSDTAGFRETDNEIEKEGISRSWKEAQVSDIVLLTIDSSKEPSDNELEIYKKLFSLYKEKTILVLNKSDKLKKDNIRKMDFFDQDKTMLVSAKNNHGISVLDKSIQKKIQTIFSELNSPFLLNKRQYNIISELKNKISDFLKKSENRIEHEILASEIMSSLEKISELTGKNITEKALDKIFKDFCIGK